MARLRPLLPCLALAASLAGGGCVSHVALQDAEAVAPYAELSARAAELPSATATYAVHPPGGQTVRVTLDVVLGAHGASRPVLLLQPGMMADGSTWRYLVGALGNDHDCLVVDPPGTGRSDVPDPEAAGPRAYSPSWLAEHTLLALREWQASRPVPRAVVPVGHSLGATVVLRMFADPDLAARYGDVLAHMDRAVLLAPADLAMRETHPSFTQLAELTDTEARLGNLLGVLPATIERGVYENAVCPERDALRQEADRILGMLRCERVRHAQQAMIRRFNPVDACGRRDWSAIERLVAPERGVHRPLLVVWGACDETLPLASARGLLERLPNERLVVLPDAKHSVHQEKVVEVARLVREFVGGPPAEPLPAAGR